MEDPAPTNRGSRRRDPVLRIEDVTLAVGTKEVLTGATLHIHPGDRCGIVGPNGAGKTTLLRLFMRELEAERGQVYIAGWERTAGSIARVYAWGIGADAPRPERQSVRERVKRLRERESQEDKDFRLARERSKRRKIKVDPLMAAFYGVK